MQLTLGPILFDWKREEILRFYDEVADMPVDRVYIGEVICAKRKGLGFNDIEAVGKRLMDTGKEIVVSTLAVVTDEEELSLVRGALNLPFLVEANDMSVFNMTLNKGSKTYANKEIVAGPHITSYNVPSIELLNKYGVKRVVFPVELSRDSIAYNIVNTGVEGEVFVHGKIPLAFSWRCYTSRAYDLNKSSCRYHCSDFPDGMVVKTLKGEPVFTVNGTSVLSALTYTLIEFVDDLKKIGVTALRISPQYRGTSKIVDTFRKMVKGEIGHEEGVEAVTSDNEGGLCNGWYHGIAGKEYRRATG